jgi:predicted nucleic acid-binding protein
MADRVMVDTNILLRALHQNLPDHLVLADETKAVTDKLTELIREHPTGGKQIHDANIVTTMLTHDIRMLFTLNQDDFRRFEGKISLKALV